MEIVLISVVGLDFTSGWVRELNRTDGHRVKLFEESVTFIAQLHNDVMLLDCFERNQVQVNNLFYQSVLLVITIITIKQKLLLLNYVMLNRLT